MGLLSMSDYCADLVPEHEKFVAISGFGLRAYGRVMI